MNIFKRLSLAVMLMVGLSGCTSMLDSGNEISLRESIQPASIRYPVTIRVAGYKDVRKSGDARLLGRAAVKVVGMSGTDIQLDRNAADVVAASMTARMDEAGFQMVDRNDAAAMFELGGEVRELSYDVKDRDYVSIAVLSTLTDAASGKVVWSGEVAQKGDRFAGVSGNTRGDIADYLREQLAEVSSKTADAVMTSLKTAHGDLFVRSNATVPGVTVFVNSGKQSDVPKVSSPTPPATENGLLTVRSEPARARLYVDGVYQGMTPLSVESTPGVHAVEVKLKGYRTASERVAVRKGDTTELEVQMEK